MWQVATTVKDEKIVTPNGVICIGYTDINSRLASTSSSLYANNQMKWCLATYHRLRCPPF